MVLMSELRRLDPNIPFQVQNVDWKSSQSLVLRNVQLGDSMKAEKVTLHWKYEDLVRGHMKELKIEAPQILLDLSNADQMTFTSKKSNGSFPIHLDRLIVERGKLTIIGLGRSIPPVEIDIEGEFPDVPMGSELSRANLDKIRDLTLRNLVFYSPLDLAVPLVRIPQLDIRFTMGGVQQHHLESLAFRSPTLAVDRGLFWFVDQMRATSAHRKKKEGGADWMVSSFEITEGTLDISRLKELNLHFPFPFEYHQLNMNLNQLNLADAQFQLDIPTQDVAWEKEDIFFKSLHGKIAFHMSGSAPGTASTSAQPHPAPVANDLVNTLYVDAIRWKEAEMKTCWLSLTFDTKAITGMYGGNFADGYINGGTTCGWSPKDPWRVWGAAANIDTGKISQDFKNESYAMNGRAALQFDATGKGEEMQGAGKLDSKSPGEIQISALDRVLERIEKNTVGMKRELLRVFVQSLKNYPYDSYAMRVNYQRPEAVITFRAKGPAGARDLDVNWHGLSIESFNGTMHTVAQSP